VHDLVGDMDLGHAATLETGHSMRVAVQRQSVLDAAAAGIDFFGRAASAVVLGGRHAVEVGIAVVVVVDRIEKLRCWPGMVVLLVARDGADGEVTPRDSNRPIPALPLGSAALSTFVDQNLTVDQESAKILDREDHQFRSQCCSC